MVGLVRDPKTGSWKSRKVIPKDVRAAYGQANETPTWSAALSPAQAKAAYAAWLAEVEAKIERLRQIAVAVPVSLNNREVHALAGKWYAQQVQSYEDDPGDPFGWEVARYQIEADDEEAAYDAHLRGEMYDGPIKRIAWLEEQLSELLEAEALVLVRSSRDAVLDRLHELYLPLCDLMIRRGSGDYGPDPQARTLPAWERLSAPSEPQVSELSIMDLFDRYAAERKPAAATLKAWKRQLGHLKTFLGHEDARRVADVDIVRWKDDLLAGQTRKGTARSVKTVRDTYLAVAKTIFGYAVENRLLPSNPAAGVTVRGPKSVRLRDRGLTDAEAKIILTGTFAPPSGLSPERALAFRWVPWLCAYTGARVNEMTQLRKEDVFQDEGVWVLRITPEAGSTKTGGARIVPLHSHLIEQGFAKVAQRAKAGPLFFDPKRRRGGTEGNPQSKKVGEALAKWVRKLGVTDANVQPSHGWRHRYETEMRRAQVDIEARHALVGHAYKTESGSYGQWAAKALSREVEKLPRYEAEGAAGSSSS